MHNQGNLTLSFPLFQTATSLAHHYWKQCVTQGDTVIDATCGNGWDALFLASLALTPFTGALHLFDIQEKAIEETKKRLSSLDPETRARIVFHHGCHTEIASCAPKAAVALIVYNLGYLPGSDKSITTISSKTRVSITQGLELLRPGGVMSITCYPGHSEGAIEETMIVEMARTLDPKSWSACHHQWLNRNNAPSLMLLQKAQSL